MNIRIYFLVVALFVGTVAFGQVSYRTTPFQIKKVSTFSPRNASPDKYDARLYSTEAPSPGGDGYKDFLLRQKERIEKDFPRKTSVNKSASRAAAKSPTVIDSFGVFWNGPNGKSLTLGGNPNDNSMAFSDKYLIASWNSRIFFYDLEADTPMINPAIGWTHLTFQEFSPNINLTHAFDPKILYEPNLDRFVLLYLDVDAGDRFGTSKTIMGFSTTNNPMDDWNIYEIDGNPMNNQTWSDYPQIAFTEDELFFTINLLTGDDWVGDFQRTIIWQIDKSSGFNGDTTLNTVLWDSIYHNGQALRYFNPADYGTSDMGKEMYFISNRAIPVNPDDTINYSYDSLFVAKIDNTIASGQAKLTVNKAKADTRTHTSPLARQPTGGKRFWTNDSRILGAFYHNGQIQFVGNSIDTTNGNSAIYHGFASDLNGNMDVKINIISHDTLDIGFPNLSYVGDGAQDDDCIIGFNHSSPYDFAGFSCVYYNGAGDYSPVTRVVDGAGYVFTNSYPTSQRWGDYFGIQRNYTEEHSVWMLGYYGRPNNTSGMYLAKVQAPRNLASVNATKKENPSRVFPNPSSDRVYVDLELKEAAVLHFELFDLQGKKVDEILNTYAKSGRSQFSFNSHYVQAGTYVLKVRTNDEIIATHRLILK